ncbi:MAG: NTP transferase domain-containing protein [Bacteroidetes bacterium]|nr:NTP transferase domain-containing protein [Bacteroidota bacterium]
MKAIIPVAGVGTRLRPHTYSQPKPLIPVAGKPILGFIIDRMVKAGFTEFIFVIGYLGEKIESFVKENYPHLSTHFVIQNKREGLGHAIYLTREFIKPEEELFIVLGDTIFEADIESVMQLSTSALGLKKVDDPREFGVAEVDEDFNILRVIEKPSIPKSNLALVGLYKIKESEQLFIALEQIIKHAFKTQGEYHLTDALMLMIQQGIIFKGFKIQNWYDCGKKDILLETNAILLKKLHPPQNITWPYQNTIIIEPVSIAANCDIKNSIIGPNVTLGENTIVNYSIVRNSIIGNDATIDDVVLHDSVIGSDTFIKGLSQSLNIGDNTEIDLSQSYD